jgi:hypothetical protein
MPRFGDQFVEKSQAYASSKGESIELKYFIQQKAGEYIATEKCAD